MGEPAGLGLFIGVDGGPRAYQEFSRFSNNARGVGGTSSEYENVLVRSLRSTVFFRTSEMVQDPYKNY